LTAGDENGENTAVHSTTRISLAAVLFLALAPAASAAAPADQRASLDERKTTDLITDYGSNADLPPDRWSCPLARGGKPLNYQKTPLEYASDLKCLTEWLWSVSRYFAAGGKVKKGLEPEFVASERARAVALANRLSQWAAKIAVPPSNPGPLQ